MNPHSAVRTGLIALLVASALGSSCASTGAVPPSRDCRVQCDPAGPDGAGCGPCGASTEPDRAMTGATRAAFELQRVLLPLSQLPPGPARDRQICAQAAVIRDRARAISEGPVPAPYRYHEYDWTAQADRLFAQANALLTVCTVTPPPTISDLAAAVRAAFQTLAARLGIEALPPR
ncbi:MAG: hypothetical protein Q8S73_22935 [Deltaproteobacteria bacterium]|nr:hypothetical protein [Myxococcales bacterium]MDP3216985.1 hypothetical protein [Deltaproteobacteria bacterium]